MFAVCMFPFGVSLVALKRRTPIYAARTYVDRAIEASIGGIETAYQIQTMNTYLYIYMLLYVQEMLATTNSDLSLLCFSFSHYQYVNK